MVVGRPGPRDALKRPHRAISSQTLSPTAGHTGPTPAITDAGPPGVESSESGCHPPRTPAGPPKINSPHWKNTIRQDGRTGPVAPCGNPFRRSQPPNTPKPAVWNRVKQPPGTSLSGLGRPAKTYPKGGLHITKYLECGCCQYPNGTDSRCPLTMLAPNCRWR